MQYLHAIILGTETEPGVIPRSVDNVFVFIKKASLCTSSNDRILINLYTGYNKRISITCILYRNL